ncbi:MAG: DUF4384 domain-containing protein [Sedimentisphaerales bacterium]|nr:DUF4384 domain-containing protein [Sedimentisphaerales bacterium]
MEKCPKCGNVLEGGREGFCDQCGWKLTVTVNEEKPSIPTPANSSSAGSSDLALSINTNAFYMEGFSGIIHMRIENKTSELFNLVEVRMEGDIPVKQNSFDLILEPGKSKERRFQLNEIKSKGPKAVIFKIQATKGDKIFDYRAEVTLNVRERIDDASKMLSNAGNLELGRASEKFNIGGVINIDIKNMIDSGKIKTANDLMQEYEHLPVKFNPVEIEMTATRQTPKPRKVWLYVVCAVVVLIFCTIGFVYQANKTKSDNANEILVKAQAARTSAMNSHAEIDAPSLWKKAESYFEEGNTSFEKNLFEKAERFWSQAMEEYSAAQVYAQGVSRVRSAKEKYEAELSKYDTEVLKKYGGQTWNDLNEVISFARSAGENFDSAVECYKRALELLPIAAKEAQEEYDHQQKNTENATRASSAKQKYEDELSNYDIDLLNQYGGQSWESAKSLIINANLARDDYEKVIQYYERAFENLSLAWENVKTETEKESEPNQNPGQINETSEVVIYSFDEGVKHFVQELANFVDGTDSVCILNRITDADGTRTPFDCTLENKIYTESLIYENIKLLSSLSDTSTQSVFYITINRQLEDSILNLSAIIGSSGSFDRIDKIKISLDTVSQGHLSKMVATPEEIQQNPELKPDIIEVPPLELTYSIMGMHNNKGNWDSVVINNDSELNSGDCFKINFQTNEDCYFYVLLYGSGGISQSLFPHEEISIDNRVKRDKLYTLPDKENWYYLDNVIGIETIYFVACYEPMKDIAGIMAKMEQAETDNKLNYSREIQKEISSIQTRGLNSDEYVINQFRGVSNIAPKPEWNLKYYEQNIQAVTDVVKGAGSVVKIVSFKHQ